MSNITIDELSNKIFNDTKLKTLEFVKFIDVNIKNINKVVVHCMELVEKYKNISGEEKFNLVVKVINEVINSLNIEDEDKDHIKLLLPNTIETINKVSKNGFDIKKKNLVKLNTKKIIELIYIKIKAILVSNNNLNVDYIINNTTYLIFSIINLVEEMPNIPKRIKKDIAIHIVKKLIKDLPNIDENKKKILKIMTDSLPDTIDLVVAAANGKLELNQQKIQQVSNCCIKLFCKLCLTTNTI